MTRFRIISALIRGSRQIFDLLSLPLFARELSEIQVACLEHRISEQIIKQRFVGFGMGYQSMSPALRDLESIILERKLRHGGHPVMNMCANNAVVERDTAGNRKLSKKRASGRIDGMIALTMALGVAPLRTAARFDVEALIA